MALGLAKHRTRLHFLKLGLSIELCIVDIMLHPSYFMSNSLKIFFLASRHAQLNSPTLTFRDYLGYLTSYKTKFFRTS